MSNVISMSKHKTSLFLRDLREKAGNTIFSVEFYKKDGTFRKLKGRFGVGKGVTGGGLAFDPLERGMLPIYDMEKQGFRMVTVDNIERLKIRGKTYEFGDY